MAGAVRTLQGVGSACLMRPAGVRRIRGSGRSGRRESQSQASPNALRTGPSVMLYLHYAAD